MTSRRAGVVEALEAVTAGHMPAARAAALSAARSGSLVGEAVVRYLNSDVSGQVYAQPVAFEAFISGGGNAPLYGAVCDALAALYDRRHPEALLDIGCGNGRAVVPALQAARQLPVRLDLVEPSQALLATAVQDVSVVAPSVRVRSWATTIQAMLKDVGPQWRWPMAQATFALHAIPHDERTTVLAALRPHVDLLAVVDFDVPDQAVGGPDHLRFLAETYEQGLAEYDADRDLVAQGFLMPVLVGQLRPGARRVTWEQSAERWRAQLTAAGFRDVAVQRLCDYWSAPAFLLTGRGA